MNKSTNTFSQYLVENGLIDASLKEALEKEASTTNQPFENLLWISGLVDENSISQLLSHYAHIPLATTTPVNLETLVFFDPQTIIQETDTEVSLFRTYPPSVPEKTNFNQLFMGKTLCFFLITPSHFKGMQKQIWANGPKIKNNAVQNQTSASHTFSQLIEQAFAKNASDIHFHPKGRIVEVKLRIDGFLQTLIYLHHDVWESLLIHLKVKSKLNIADTQRPQSGAFAYHFGACPLFLRFSTHPSLHGETSALRLLGTNTEFQHIHQLKLPLQIETNVQSAVTKGSGLFLVVGPTGSGKTTTLYALLHFLNTRHKHIVTLEHPIERRIPGFTQTEVQDSGTLSFDEGVRSALRQDPDILLVGETRDAQTAEAVFRASMTGHQTFTTLHASTPEEALKRLTDLKISTALQNAQIQMILAQRLIPKLCMACKEPQKNTAYHTYKPKGCSDCGHTGYKGRLLLAELLTQTPHQGGFKKAASTFKTQAQEYLEQGFVALEDVQALMGETV